MIPQTQYKMLEKGGIAQGKQDKPEDFVIATGEPGFLPSDRCRQHKNPASKSIYNLVY
jgi:hypothetical protein